VTEEGEWVTAECEACGVRGAGVHLGPELLCDHCVDQRVSAMTGMPRLPDPPPDELLTGPDGRGHRFRFRLWRAPTGVVAEAEEAGLPPADGYHFKITGAHDVDVDALLANLKQGKPAGVFRLYLKPHPNGEGWMAAGDDVSGRLEWSDRREFGEPYDVIVDGRRLTWEQFGRSLGPFEGWDFTLSIEDADVVDPTADDTIAAEVIPWPKEGTSMGSGHDTDSPDELALEDEDEFLKAWDEAEASAVKLLQRSLSGLIDEGAPQEALAAAANRLRAGMRDREWPFDHMRRAAGWAPCELPKGDLELWLGATGGLISMRESSGLDDEAESSIMALEHADWLGSIVGVVRAGVGASAEPEALVGYVNDCPEVDGNIDPDDAFLVEGAFEQVLPAWEAAGAVDSKRRLTPLGRWGLPRALAWAWNGNFDVKELA
jgi:hypothetical protein